MRCSPVASLTCHHRSQRSRASGMTGGGTGQGGFFRRLFVRLTADAGQPAPELAPEAAPPVAPEPPKPIPAEPPKPIAPEPPRPEPVSPPPQQGWFDRLSSGLTKSSAPARHQPDRDLHPSKARPGDARRARGGADPGRSRPRSGGADRRGDRAGAVPEGDRARRGAAGAGGRGRQGIETGGDSAAVRERAPLCGPDRRGERLGQDHHHRQARGRSPRAKASR